MASKKEKSPLQLAVQNALQVTWLLKGHLKNAQIAYIRVGVGLAKVRDEKLYVALKHPDLEDYAMRRLNLGRASLYRYLQVHDWILKHHKEWLEPRPKGFIPDLADVADLIWIEREMARKNLLRKMKEALEELQAKAMDGSLRQGELGRFRKQGRRPSDESLRAFLKKLKLLRKRGADLKDMPSEVISEMDSAIGILEHAIGLLKVAVAFGGTASFMPPKKIAV